MESGSELSPQVWAALGVFCMAHFGSIWAVLKGYFARETAMALVNQRLDFMNQTMGEIKAGQVDLKKDVDAAFAIIRKDSSKGA